MGLNKNQNSGNFNGEVGDMSNYATKSDLATKVTKETNKSLVDNTLIDKLEDLENYDDSLIKEEINILDNKIDDKQDELISGSNIKTINGQSILGNGDITINEGENVDLSDYATKDDLNTKANIDDIPTKTSQLENDSNYLTSIPEEYITNEELNNKGYLTEHQDISEKADKTELFSKDYNDLINKPNIPSLDGYATENYVKSAIANAQLGDKEVDLSGYATIDALKLKADLKANNSEVVKKTDIVTAIDNSSTNAQVPTAKAVNDILSTVTGITNVKIYYLLSQLEITKPCTIKDIWDKMPSGSVAIVDTDSSIVTDLDVIRIALGISEDDEAYGILTVVKLEQRTMLEFRRAHANSVITPDTFIGYCHGVNCTQIQWKRMVMTSVADVAKITITPVFPSGVVVASGKVAINYVVKNGWCNVNFAFNITSATALSWNNIATGLPKPANSVNILLMNDGGKISRTIAIKINSDGSVSSKVPYEISTADWWTGNFSYPVAE